MDSPFCENLENIRDDLQSRRTPNEIDTPAHIVHTISNFRHFSVKDSRDEDEGTFFNKHCSDFQRLDNHGDGARERIYRIENCQLHWSRHQMFSTYTFYCMGNDHQGDSQFPSVPERVSGLTKVIPGDIADRVSLVALPAPSFPFDEREGASFNPNLEEAIKYSDEQAKLHDEKFKSVPYSKLLKKYDHDRKAKFHRRYEDQFRYHQHRLKSADVVDDVNRRQELQDEIVWSARQILRNYKGVTFPRFHRHLHKWETEMGGLEEAIKYSDEQAKLHDEKFKSVPYSKLLKKYDHDRKAKFHRRYEDQFRYHQHRLKSADVVDDVNRRQELQDEIVWSARQILRNYKGDLCKINAKTILNIPLDTVLYGNYSMSDASIWTPFATNSRGPTPFLIYEKDLHPNHLKRIISLTLDMWTYSILILHLVKTVKAHLPAVNETADKLRNLMQDIKVIVGTTKTEEHLAQLLDNAESIEKLYADIGGHLETVPAYTKIVQERIEQLEIEKIPETQDMNTFIMDHIMPQVRQCTSVECKLRELSLRNARATGLVSTKVDLAVHQESKNLLKSLDKNSDTNVQLQHAVEVLSVIPLTYYVYHLVHGAFGFNLGQFQTGALFIGICVCVYLAHLWAGRP